MISASSLRHRVFAVVAIGLMSVAATQAFSEPAPAGNDDIARYYFFDYHRLEGRSPFSVLAEQGYRQELARRNWRGFYVDVSLPVTFGYFSVPLYAGITNLRLGPVSFSGDLNFVFNMDSGPNTVDDLTFSSTGNPRIPSGFRMYENSEWQRVYSLATLDGGFSGLVGVRGEVGWQSMATFSFMYRTQNYSSINTAGTTEDFGDVVYEWGLMLHPRSILNANRPIVPQSISVRAIQQEARLDGYVGAITTPDLPFLETLSFGRTNVLGRYFGSAYFVSPDRALSAVFHLTDDDGLLRSVEAGFNIATLIAPDDIRQLARDGTIIDWNVGVRYDRYQPWQQSLFLAPENHLSLMFQIRLLTVGGGIDSDLAAFFQLFDETHENRILPTPLSIFMGLDF